MSHTHYDIIIMGAGIVGLTAAAALKDTSLRIAIIDGRVPKLDWSDADYDLRVSAITPASKHIFQSLGIWQRILELRASVYRDMDVWDECGQGRIHFSSAEMGEPELGFIIENRVLLKALLEYVRRLPLVHELCPVKPLGIEESPEKITVRLDDGREITTKLLVGADGANSWVREQAGFDMHSWDYQHTAIVATVQHQQAHHNTARQRFLRTGPLAFLPLQDEFTSSIVWSTAPAHAEQLLTLSDEQFKNELGLAFEQCLGLIEKLSPRMSFPLRMRQVKHYVKPRIALMGDAAHTIHPLAGQGLNLGLLDAACFAEVLIKALAKPVDVGMMSVLRRYERWRKGHVMLMIASMEGFKQLFGTQLAPVVLLRNIGLSIVDRLSGLKNMFSKAAMSTGRDLPEIAKKKEVLY